MAKVISYSGLFAGDVDNNGVIANSDGVVLGSVISKTGFINRRDGTAVARVDQFGKVKYVDGYVAGSISNDGVVYFPDGSRAGKIIEGSSLASTYGAAALLLRLFDRWA